MGFFRKTFSLTEAVHQVEAGPAFVVDEESIPPEVFGLVSYASPTSPAPRISRREAIQCSPVKRIRDLIAGTLGTLPVDLFDPAGRQAISALFEQPEPDVPRSVTMTRTFEDMLFEGVAWWRVLERGWHGYPVKVRRLDARTVNVRQDQRVYVASDGQMQGAAEEWVPDKDLIRFDSPNDALLIAAARSIRTCLALDAAAANNADGVPPVDYFTPAEDADPAEDDEIVAILNSWRDARRTRSTGYVPAALKYNSAGFNPDQLQMAEQRQHAVLDIARHGGVDAEDVGVSTTSRTYANQFDRRKAFTDFTLGGYLTAMQDRLSMNDVCPRGYRSRLDLDEFQRSDPKTRYESYEIGKRVGAITGPEIREAEGKPALSEADLPTPPALPAPRALPAPTPAEETPMAASQNGPVIQFEGGPTLRLDAPTGESFEVDVENRVIRGLIVPYGVPARSNGQWWQFAQGTLTYAAVSRVKLWVQHDPDRAVGVAFELDDRPDGMWGAYRVANTPAGDHALQMASDGVWDGFSIGLGQGGKFVRRGQVNHAVSAPLMETSLTPSPSFDDARVHTVAASAANERNAMPCPTCGNVHAAGVVECTTTAPEAPDFSAITTGVTEAITTAFANLANPQQQVTPPEVIPAGGPLQVTEALPYRFDGLAAEHSFSADLRAMASGDASARQRLDEFMDEAFAVTTGNATALNPTVNRPELYVPNLEFTRPLWSLVSTGVVTDVTPFTIPKFASAAGLVGPHVQGVEPTPGSFSATNQTVTPAPVSGKIEINREVWDQGGNPKADAIIWREIVNGYYEAIEAKIATMLNGLALTEINLGGAVNQALVTAVQNIFVDLQFVRGGNRYSAFALDGMLFKALVGAVDGGGRNLLPVLSPQNADGTTAGNFSELAIGSQRGVAAWPLGATVASNSYLFVPGSVWAWASAPKRFTFEYQVKSVDMAVWGYTASAVLRDTDVKRIDYTTADV